MAIRAEKERKEKEKKKKEKKRKGKERREKERKRKERREKERKRKRVQFSKKGKKNATGVDSNETDCAPSTTYRSIEK